MTTSPAQALADHAASGTTAQVAASLLILDTMPADKTTRVAGAALVEVLAARHPDEVRAAADAWANDAAECATLHPDGPSLIEAIVAAIPAEALR